MNASVAKNEMDYQYYHGKLRLNYTYRVTLINSSWSVSEYGYWRGDLISTFELLFDENQDLIGITLLSWYDLQDVGKLDNDVLAERAYKAARSPFAYFGVSDVTNETLGEIDRGRYRCDESADSIVFNADFDLSRYRFKYLIWQDDKGYSNHDNFWKNNGSEGDYCDNRLVKDDSDESYNSQYHIKGSFDIYARNGTIIDSNIRQYQSQVDSPGGDDGTGGENNSTEDDALLGTLGSHGLIIALLVTFVIYYKFRRNTR